MCSLLSYKFNYVAYAFLPNYYMVPLALVVIFPIVVVIALYHTITEPAGAPMAVVLLALNLFLAYYNRASYAALLQVSNAWKS